jgi:tetratricopeptide (TPR) repeat protein
LQQGKDLDAAAASAQKAMQSNLGDAEAILLYAQIQVPRGQVANAIAVWGQWANAHPMDAGAAALLGTLEEARGNEPKAKTNYRKTLQIQPEQLLAANMLAYLMLENDENTDVALNLAKAARRVLPNSTSTADILAWAYYKKGAYAFARDLLEDAVKTNGNNVAMQYNNLGMVHCELANKNSAVLPPRSQSHWRPNRPPGRTQKSALEEIGAPS